MKANVNSNTVWKLDKCVIYGLSDASLNWYCRVKSLLLEFGTCVSKVDVYGMLACYVDDFIGGGGGEKPKFENVISVGKESNKVFKYCGFDLENDEDGVLYLDQVDYTDLLRFT